jgi:hypothetical protein
MTRMGVTHAKLTPSVAEQLTPTNFPTLKYLHLTSKDVTLQSAACWMPDVDVWNTYGPTECTNLASVMNCSHPQWAFLIIEQSGASCCFVTDPRNPKRRMRRHCAGEILVEGPNVTRGYLNNS